jgi:hypothetical protein
MQYQFGSAMAYNFNCGSYWSNNVHDQVAPYALPAWPVTFNARTNSTAYTAGTIVSTGGFYIQYSANCTSGVGAPTLQLYGVNITDGTCLNAQLIGPTTYYGMQIDTGSQENSVSDSDFTCICTAGIIIMNTFAGTAAFMTHLNNVTPGGNIFFGINALDGTWLKANHVEVNGCLTSGCVGIYLQSTWDGPAIITGAALLNDLTYGILISGGNNAAVANSVITATHSDALRVSANINRFAFTGNIMSVTAGAGITIDAGTSNRYTITGNVCGGAALTDGGTGVNKIVQASCP